MRIEIITLPQATERHKKLTESFSKYDLKYDLVSGITPSDCNFYYEKGVLFCDVQNTKIQINEEKIKHIFNRSSIAFGEFGAFSAHYLRWKEFLNSTDEYLIICEDDAVPMSDLSFVKDLFTNNPAVNFLNLQSVTAHVQEKKPLFKTPWVSFIGNDIVVYREQFEFFCEGMCGYAINKKMATYLCAEVDLNGFYATIDGLFMHLGRHGIIEITCPFNVDQCFNLNELCHQSFTYRDGKKSHRQFNHISIEFTE
jgi:GR25 family glycosyltransferase involved in LPS biosynthesis